jgi:hypothetical protein
MAQVKVNMNAKAPGPVCCTKEYSNLIPNTYFQADIFAFRMDYNHHLGKSDYIERVNFFLSWSKGLNLIKTEGEMKYDLHYHEHFSGKFWKFCWDIDIQKGLLESIKSDDDVLEMLDVLIECLVEILNDDPNRVPVTENDFYPFITPTTKNSTKYSARLIGQRERINGRFVAQEYTKTILNIFPTKFPEVYFKYRLHNIVDQNAFTSMRMPFCKKPGGNASVYYDRKNKTLIRDFNFEIFVAGLVTYPYQPKDISLSEYKVNYIDFSSRDGSYGENKSIPSKDGLEQIDMERDIKIPRIQFAGASKSNRKVAFTDSKTIAYSECVEAYYKTYYRSDFLFDWKSLKISNLQAEEDPSRENFRIVKQLPCCYIYRTQLISNEYERRSGRPWNIVNQLEHDKNYIRPELIFTVDLKERQIWIFCWNHVCKGRNLGMPLKLSVESILLKHKIVTDEQGSSIGTPTTTTTTTTTTLPRKKTKQ